MMGSRVSVRWTEDVLGLAVLSGQVFTSMLPLLLVFYCLLLLGIKCRWNPSNLIDDGDKRLCSHASFDTSDVILEVMLMTRYLRTGNLEDADYLLYTTLQMHIIQFLPPPRQLQKVPNVS